MTRRGRASDGLRSEIQVIRRIWTIGVAALLLGTAQSASRAGECPAGDTVEPYLRVLREGPGSPDFDYAVYCLGGNPIVDSERWAGPIAAATFARLRSDPHRGRLIEVVRPLLATPWADSSDHRQQLYAMLARRGIAKLDTIDVFTMLMGPGKPFYLNIYPDVAALQDCRAVPLLRSRYAELRVHPERGGYFEQEILHLINCLYHIPCPEAVEAARQLRAGESDKTLRERLERVINRK